MEFIKPQEIGLSEQTLRNVTAKAYVWATQVF